jgi:hypothetical protein
MLNPTYNMSNLAISGSTLTVNNASTGCKGKIAAEDVVIDGVSMKEQIEAINKRLAILIPDPELLAEYETLREAYEHYKTLEALLHKPKKDKD